MLGVLLLLVAAVGACSGDSDGDTADGGTGGTGGTGGSSTTATTRATATTRSTRPAQPDVATDATQPPQPDAGPGGSAYAHGDWRVGSGGSGNDAWYVFEPVDPAPRSAPVTVVMHGYFEYAGYDQFHEFIRHTVRAGSIVVYPRYQTDVAEPCPGPVDIEPCITSSVNGIRGALDYLEADPERVQPDLERASYFGFSFGGILTANLANRYAALGLPEPRVVFLDDPHDGGVAGDDEPALDDTLAGIPSSTLVLCHSSAKGVISEAGKDDASCNAVFPELDHIPAEGKSLVLTHPDRHGVPPSAASALGPSTTTSRPSASCSTPSPSTSSLASGPWWSTGCSAGRGSATGWTATSTPTATSTCPTPTCCRSWAWCWWTASASPPPPPRAPTRAWSTREPPCGASWRRWSTTPSRAASCSPASPPGPEAA